jgi:membrane protein implicated in regulation of membrane protease activity
VLEAIFKLLKLEMQIAVAVVTLVSGAILWLLRPLVRRMWNALGHSKAQPVPERQDQEVTVAPANPARP